MRKILGAAFVSLDGVMQAPGGPTEDPSGGFAHGGWLPQFFDEGVGSAIDTFFVGEYDLLLGRRTYEIFAAYWPYVGGDATGIGEVFDFLGKDEGEAAAVEMGRAFTRARKYVLTRGAPDPQLIEAGVLDGATLMVCQVVLGSGKREVGGARRAKELQGIDHNVAL